MTDGVRVHPLQRPVDADHALEQGLIGVVAHPLVGAVAHDVRRLISEAIERVRIEEAPPTQVSAFVREGTSVGGSTAGCVFAPMVVTYLVRHRRPRRIVAVGDSRRDPRVGEVGTGLGHVTDACDAAAGAILAQRGSWLHQPIVVDIVGCIEILVPLRQLLQRHLPAVAGSADGDCWTSSASPTVYSTPETGYMASMGAR